MRSGTVSETGWRRSGKASWAAAPGARRGPCFQPLISEHQVTDARAISRGDLDATYRFGVELVKNGVLLSVGTKMSRLERLREADVDRTLEIAERALRRGEGVAPAHPSETRLPAQRSYSVTSDESSLRPSPSALPAR